MKLSILFNESKTEQYLQEIEDYIRLSGLDRYNIEISIENDIGEPGKLFDEAIFLYTIKGVVVQNHKEAYEVVYIPGGASRVMLPGEVKINKCYCQPKFKKGFDLGNIYSYSGIWDINELYTDSRLHMIFDIANGSLRINKVYVSGNDSLISNKLEKALLSSVKIGSIEYDEKCKYLCGLYSCKGYSDILKRDLSEHGLNIDTNDFSAIHLSGGGQVTITNFVTGLVKEKAELSYLSDELLYKIYKKDIPNSIFRYFE